MRVISLPCPWPAAPVRQADLSSANWFGPSPIAWGDRGQSNVGMRSVPGQGMADARPHTHADQHEVALIFDGRAGIQIEGAARELASPAVLVAPAGAMHSVALEQGGAGCIVSIDQFYARELAGREPAFRKLFAEPDSYELASQPMAAADLRGAAERLRRELGRSGPAFAAGIEGCLLTLLAECARLLVNPKHEVVVWSSGQAALVARFRDLIGDQPRAGASIGAYAEQLGVTAGQLRSACRSVTGEPPLKILHAALLRRAQHRLSGDEQSVSEIAYDMGFCDPTHFSRFFSERTGEAPVSFRKRMWSR
jgi:AraC family transcriptional activator of pobA